jgi:MFS family permease
MTGFYQMAFLIGLAISPLLGGLLTDALGFRPAVRICAAISAAGLALAFVALPETKQTRNNSQPTSWSGMQRQQLTSYASAWRKVDRRLLRAAYITLVTFFVNAGVMMSTIGLYIGQRWGKSISVGSVLIGVASLAGLMLAMRALLGMLAGPVAGTVSDRLRDRWPVVRVGILLGVTGFLILALLGHLWAIPVGVALVALSVGGLLTVLYALVGDLSSEERQGITVGGLATAGDIGSAMGPLAAYALAAVMDLRWVYLICAVILASALVATLGLNRPE